MEAADGRPHACREERAMWPCYVNTVSRKVAGWTPSRDETKVRDLATTADCLIPVESKGRPVVVASVRVTSFIRCSMMRNKFAWGWQCGWLLLWVV